MESLPPEMVVEVGQYLTPRDLASCSAVCQSWRDIFNNDSLWQQHCDPSLAEPLEKTPCVVEPRFVSPEVETSRLTPISHWRMAFLREQHLWGNWKKKRSRGEDILKIYLEIGREFLSETLLVRYSFNWIQIWNVSTGQAIFMASKEVESLYSIKAYRTNRLLVSHKGSVKVFHVDPSENNVIELVHDISVDSHEPNTIWPNIEEELNCVNGSIYIHVNANRLTLDVIDLEKGMKIKTETCPVLRKENQNASIYGIKSSTNSEYMIVMVKVPWSIGEEYHCYVYSVGQFVFSSRPIFKHFFGDLCLYAINGDYLAFSHKYSFKICNCFTLELVSESTSHYYGSAHVFNNGFVSLVSSEEDIWIGMFSLASKTWSWTIVGNHLFCREFLLEIINNKFIRCSDYGNEDGVWEASGQSLKRSDISNINSVKINESFTRGISDCTLGLCVYCYW